MKKIKRILALITAILLFCLYGSTLIFALVGSSVSLELLKASIAATIILPVLMYAYSIIYRLSKKNASNDDSSDK